MNIKFSIKRIVWLLRTDLIEHKKSIGLIMVIMVLVQTYFMWQVMKTGTETFPGKNLEYSIHIQFLVFLITSFITFLLFCSHVVRKINNRQSTYLILPANNAEKLVTFVIELFLAIWLVIGLTYISILLWNCLFYEHIQYCIATVKGDFVMLNIFKLDKLDIPIGPLSYMVGTVLALLFLLGAFTFKKRAIAISICLIFIGCMAIIYTCSDFISYINPGNYTVVYQNYYHGLFKVIVDYQTWIFPAFSLWLLYIVYLKFSEKEHR